MKLTNFLITVFLAVCVFTQLVFTQTLEVKPNRSAIVKEAPTATAEHFDERLPAGVVAKGDAYISEIKCKRVLTRKAQVFLTLTTEVCDVVLSNLRR